MGVALTLDTKSDLENLDYSTLRLTEEDKESHLMQLQTLIAYFYLRGLDYFGGLPIFTSNDQEGLPRSSDVETFEHVEQLLTDVLPKLPKKQLGEAEEGEIKQAAAAAMLAKLYFNAEAYIGEDRFDECAEICQDILNGEYGEYALDPDWHGPHDFFNNESPEIIWSTPSERNKLEYRWFYEYFYHYESYKYFGTEGGGWNGAHLQPSRKPTDEIYDFKLGKPYESFHDEDLRKKPYLYRGNGNYEGMFLVGEQTNPLTGESSYGTQEYSGEIITFVDKVARFSELGSDEYSTVEDLTSTMAVGEENTGVRLVKVPQPDMADDNFRWGADNPVIRLAEVYYMLAECKLRAGDKGEAATLINEVRERNFENGEDPDPATAQNLDDDGYRLLEEWGIEFVGEGRRRTDLIRWNKFVHGTWWDHEPSGEEHLRRFPVPQEAISGNNKLEQNPGY
jgi:hypothetical protein